MPFQTTFKGENVPYGTLTQNVYVAQSVAWNRNSVNAATLEGLETEPALNVMPDTYGIGGKRIR